jgi:hypothetical protein
MLISVVFFIARAKVLFGILIKLRNFPSAISVLTALVRLGLGTEDFSLNVTPRSSHVLSISRTLAESGISFR